MANSNSPSFRILGSISKNADLFVALAAIGVVLMLIIPISPIFMDILLILNLSLALLVILSTIYVHKPSDFSAFPTLILLSTVFSLALNVSSTRLILTQGFAGNVINAFGNFVAGGNLVVGFVIFAILLAIQFLVITKGATRVSEVSARFALDALPGKQLTINEELNSGSIGPEEANQKRNALNMEVNFYGAMDGSSKFVSGNAQVAVVIVIVNIIGGLITGMMRGQSIAQAGQTYVILTIGDGLVSQIPALLLSVSTGIIVTRNSANENFAGDVAKQIIMLPRTLYITGVTLLAIGFLPGFPVLLNLFMGGMLLWIGYMMDQSISAKETEQKTKEKQSSIESNSQPTIQDILHVDPMTLEIGYSLIPLVDSQQGGDLLDRIKQMRRVIGLDLGILVPPIRIIDNVGIEGQEYSIKIRGTEIGSGRVFVNRLLALNPKLDLTSIEGIESVEPAFNLPAKWISVDDRSHVEHKGFDVFDPPSVVATHLTELIRRNSHELLTRQDVQQMLDALKKEFSSVVDEALKVSNLGEIHKILQNLLKEKVKVRNMLPILETIADYRKSNPHIDALTEQIREVLAKQIAADPSVSANNNIKAVILSPDWEQILGDSIEDSSQGYVSTLDNEEMRLLVTAAGSEIELQLSQGARPVVLSSRRVRRLLKEILNHSFPAVPVLAYSEIPANFSVEQLGTIVYSKIA